MAKSFNFAMYDPVTWWMLWVMALVWMIDGVVFKAKLYTTTNNAQIADVMKLYEAEWKLHSTHSQPEQLIVALSYLRWDFLIASSVGKR